MIAGWLAGCAARGSARAHRCAMAATAAALRSPPCPPSPCTSEKAITIPESRIIRETKFSKRDCQNSEHNTENEMLVLRESETFPFLSCLASSVCLNLLLL